MARIDTLDGKTHIVKESKKEIYPMISEAGSRKDILIELNIGVSVTSWVDKEEINRVEFEPAFFNIKNIVLICNG